VIAQLQQHYPEALICGHDFAVRDEVIGGLGIRAVGLDAAFAAATAVIVVNNNPRYEQIDLNALIGSMKKPAVVYDVWSVLPPYRSASGEDAVKFLYLGKHA